MFDQVLLPRASSGAAKMWTMPASVAIQACIVTAAVIWPMLRIEPLPMVRLQTKLPPPHIDLVAVPKELNEIFSRSTTLLPIPTVPAFRVPTSRPSSTTRPGPDIDLTGLIVSPTGQDSGVDRAVIFENSVAVAQPPKPVPPPERTAAVAPKPVEEKTYRVGGDVKAPILKVSPKPGYPVLARQARIQGTVRMSGVIAKDGTVRSLELVSGHPLLVQAALEAVRTWLYEPGRLNGQPVDVLMIIDVNFTLAQ